VVLSGGTSLLNGLTNRLHQELDIMCPKSNMVGIDAPRDRQYSVWKGGSILTNLNNFRWISRADYEDEGFELIHSNL
jgi:actin-related protein